MSGQFDPRITAYFGDAVLQAGFMPVPNLFLRHYAQLDITTPQAMFLLQLMAIAWDIGSPPTNMTMLAERMGVSRRAAQMISAELAGRGIVEIFDQYDTLGAQVENGYDLGPLFQQLALLAPVSAIPGQPRERRSRMTHSNNPEQSTVVATTPLPPLSSASTPAKNISPSPVKNISSPPAKNISSPPMQNSSSPPGTPIHPPHEAKFTAPMNQTSQLKKETKNRVKKQLRKDQEQQQQAAVAETQVAQTEMLMTIEADQAISGASLRLGHVLNSDDINQSRQVLARIGLNSDVAEVAAPTLHPAECWSLWTYARGAGLGTAWIAKQIYDPRRRAPRIAGIPSRFDEVGQHLATLPATAAEKILDITLNCYPNLQDRLRQSAASAELSLPEAQLHQVLEAVWAAFAGEQRGADNHSAQHDVKSDDPSKSHDLQWAAVRARLMVHVAPDDWNTWIAPLSLLDIIGDVAVIATPNLFVRSEVATRFETLLATALAEEFGRELEIDMVIASPSLVA